MRVCSFWRTVAEATPLLWTAIHFNTALISTRSAEGSTSMLRLVLSMTKNYPLDVDIRITPLPPSQEFQFQAILDIIRDKGHRWRSLCFHPSSRSSDTWNILPFSPLSECHALERVELHNFSGFKWRHDLLALSEARSLRELVLNPFRHLTVPPNPHPALCWSQIVSLELYAPLDLHAFSSVASECTHLHTLVITDGALGTTHLPVHDIKLRSLQNLELCMRGSSVATLSEWGLCPYLNVPNLQHLALHNMHRDHMGDLVQVSNMLERSCCSITSVSITGITTVDAKVKQLLQQPGFQSVKELELAGGPSNFLFDWLAGDDHPLIELERLEVDMAYGDGRVALTSPMRGIRRLLDARITTLRVVNLRNMCFRTLLVEDIELVDEIRYLKGPSIGIFPYALDDTLQNGFQQLRLEVRAIRELGETLSILLTSTNWQVVMQSSRLSEERSVLIDILANLESRSKSTVLTDVEVKILGRTQDILHRLRDGGFPILGLDTKRVNRILANLVPRQPSSTRESPVRKNTRIKGLLAAVRKVVGQGGKAWRRSPGTSFGGSA
ncbi:hypothetical protein PM082_009765 [Marasmius tenuissimus]|nr:hypothetical protein PM082_009765 [Marasmius tenuissimus]